MIGIYGNIILKSSSTKDKLIVKYLRRSLFLLCFAWSLIYNLTGQSVGDYGSASPGPNNWSIAASWVRCVAPGTWAGAVPVGAPPANPTNVWIRPGHSINLDGGAPKTCGNMTVTGTATLTGPQRIYIYGNLVVDGTVNTTNQIRLYGSSINGTGSITSNNPFRIYSNTTIQAGAGLDFNCSIQFRNNNLTITNNGSVSIYSDPGITDNSVADCLWINAANSFLGLTGNISSAVALDASAAGNTVEYFGAGAQSVKVPITSYYHLTTSNADSKTLEGDITVLGNVIIGAGTILDVSGNNYTITAHRNWTHYGIFNENQGTVIFAGGNNQTIEGNPNETFYNLSVNKSGGVVQPINSSTDIAVSNNFVITSGTFETGGNTLSVINSSTIGGTLSVNDATGSADLKDVFFAGGTIGSATNTGTVNISGSITMPSGNGTIGRVNLYVSGTTTIPAGRSLNFSNTNGIKRFSGSVVNNGSWDNSANEDIEFRNGLTHSGSSFNSGTGIYTFTTNNQTLGGTSNITFNGNVTVTGITLNNAKTTTIKGVLSGSGTWNNNNGSVLNYENAAVPMAGGNFNVSINSNTVNYSGPGNQSIRTTTYHRLMVSNSGNKTFTGTLAINENLNIENNAILQNSGSNDIYVAGNWTDNNTADGFSEGTGEVFFNGTSQQTITKAGGTGAESYFDLTLNNSNGLLLASGDLNITNRFTFATGNITPSNSSYKVYLSAGTPASLNYTSVTGSRINGKFERGINTTGTYLFPVGSAANYNPANLIINVVPAAGSVLTEFIIADPGDSGLPLYEGGLEISDSYTDGYWSLTAKNGFSSGNYSVSLSGAGFSTAIYDITRVLKRTAGGNWVLDGNHANASGSVCYRNSLSGGISSSGTHFGFGHTRPRITDQPDDQIVCADAGVTFSITASGYAPLTYQWYKVPNIPLVEGGRFTGTNLATVNITNVVLGDAGDYYCIVTDGHGKTAQSNTADLTINPQPVAQTITKNPDVSDVCVTGSVSATFSGGSGGINPVNEYESSTDGGATWQTYTPGTPISSAVAGANKLQIRTRRTTSGTGCVNSGWNSVTWNTISQPVAQIITKNPDVNDVCISGTVSATFGGGSGGVNPTDEYESSIDGGATWQAYTPGSSISSAVAGANRLQIRTRRTSAGTGCSSSGWSSVTWNTVSQAVAQTITKNPDVSDVCISGTVSATFSGGSGGVNPTDVYESSIDGGATWQAYTPGSSISSAVAGANRLQIRTRRTSAGTGCSSSGWSLVTWNTVSQPVAQAITKNPDITEVCVTSSVSATFSGGSGGVSPTDVYESSIDGGASWQSYTPGSSISTAVAGANRLQIRTRRTSSGTGCVSSGWTTTTWTVNPQPVAPALNSKNPNLAAVCDGQLVSATVITGSGGTGCSDLYEYRFDGAGGWNSYIPGDNLNTAGHTLVEIRGQRSGCTAGSGCTGTSWVILATWIVNPMPTLTSSLTPPAICSGSAFSYTPTSGTAGTSFGWTRAAVAGITPAGPTSGTGNPNETLTNTTAAPLTVRYVYTLTANGCTNPATYNVDVVVNPMPTLTSSLTPPAICSGSAFSYTPASGTAGTSFGWTRAAVAGITPAGPTSGSGDPAETLTNTTAAPLTVRYVYTLTANGCTNPSTYNVDVVVNPIPTLTSSLTPPAICSGSAFSYTPTSGTAGTSFGWTRAAVAGITPAGPTSGTGNPNETLTNTTAAPLTVRYVYTLTANGCTNPSTYNVDVVVNPMPTLTSSLTPPAICSGSAFSYTPTSGTAGTSFGWTRAAVAGITPAGPTSGSGDPAETLTNTTAAPLTVRYVYTLTANGCTNPATYNVDVVVNPMPTLTSSLTPPAICSGSAFSYTPTSGTAGTSFGWTRAAVAGITPAGPTSGSGDPAETLTNTTAAPLTVRYVYTLTANGCTNPATYNVDVVVNPIPTLTSSLTPPAICSGSAFSYTPASGTAGTSFGWTRAAVAGITPAGPTSGSGDPAETLTNTTAAPLTVRYVYTLTANGCTNPSTYNVDVVVNPIPTLTSSLTPPAICSGSAFSYTPTSGTAGTSFGWTRAAVAGITPAGPTSGTGNPNETLTNTTAAPLTVRYVYTLTANGCTNPVNL